MTSGHEPAQNAERAVAPDLHGLHRRAKWAQLALVATALFDLVALASDIAEYRLLGGDFTLEQADANDTRQGLIGVVQLLLLIVTAVFFIRWFKRAYENVDAFGGPRRYGTGWAIGSWFVPLLFIWRPKQIANDIWRANNTHDYERVSPLLGLWWAAFLISNWIGQVTFRSAFSAETISDLRNADIAYMITDAIDVVGALLAFWVVRTITGRQISSAARIHAASAGTEAGERWH